MRVGAADKSQEKRVLELDIGRILTLAGDEGWILAPAHAGADKLGNT